jgi:hypothetical protein
MPDERTAAERAVDAPRVIGPETAFWEMYGGRFRLA